MTEEANTALDLDPKVKEFIDSLTPERVKYLEASIQFSRDRESAGRFLKFLGLLFAFVTGAIVAWDKVAVYFMGHGKP
ncbi:hypothetical protein [Mesorhizobium sp. dw_380]|uniref:hypothetical protein n=1 Tax=Mesorhizobium sp. dw_380 TaxID=2812001 RepID=UPI001BDE79FD|nr:hypothetical protein [Mesorhizobium sp. dw_380]